MADRQAPSNANDPPEQTKSDQVNQHLRESQPQTVAAARQDRRPSLGRRPLFGR
jgi:hypothetical protein